MHSLKHDFDRVVLEGEKCRLDENNLYVHKDSMDNYNDINSELARVVSDNELGMRRAIKYVTERAEVNVSISNSDGKIILTS